MTPAHLIVVPARLIASAVGLGAATAVAATVAASPPFIPGARMAYAC